jgi:hypothetical protein
MRRSGLGAAVAATLATAACGMTDEARRAPAAAAPAAAAPAAAAEASSPGRAPGRRPVPPPAAERAAPGGAGWLVDAASGCWLWTHAAPPGVAATWSGACPRGPAEGPGESRLAWTQDGRARSATMTGAFRRGRIEGEGTAAGPNGERYAGGFRDGRGNGRGALTFTNGDRYEGDIVNDMATGRGVYAWGNGDRYEGGFRDNRPDGQGRYQSRSGLFAGNWDYGCFRDPMSGTRVAMWRDVAECP